MTRAGYIRQSRRADLDVALSYDTQLAAIRRMAGDGVEIVSDMGRSGKAGGERLRPGYSALVERVRSGEVTAVYVISLSRLSRSLPELHAFMDLAQSTGCAIVSEKEGKLDPSTASGKLMFNIWASFAEYVRDLQVEAALENVAARRSRNERMGRAPYGEAPGEDPRAVADAYRAAGSMNGAALALNAAGLPSPLTRSWSGTSVRLVLQRHFPGLLPLQPAKGAKSSSTFVLYRLLRCACGRLLTASRDGRGDREVVYRCHAASTRPHHARPYRVGESAILPWVREEAARLRAPDAVTLGAQNARRRAELEGLRESLGWAVADRLLNRQQAQERAEAIELELASLDAAEQVVAIPDIDWSWEPKALNSVLRALWESIELDPDMRPVRAVWRVATWRT